MRILALISDAFGGQGGIAKFNRDLLTALAGAGGVDKVAAVPRLMPEPPGPLPDKVEFVTGGTGGKLRFTWTVLKTLFAAPRPQLIVCGHINLLPVAFLARWFCRVPVVLVIHGIDAWLPTRSWLANRLARKVDAVVAVSEFTLNNFLTWAEPARARTFILPNCVDLTQFSPGPKSPALLQRYGLAGKTVLLTVARLSAQERYKGIDEVLELLPELARQIPAIAYLIAGDGTDRARLEAKAAALGVQDRVTFAGWIKGDELAEHHRLADAYVMPGRGEGFGITYIEALACGVPVVASQLDASAELTARCDLVVAVNPDAPGEIRDGILQAVKFGRRPVAGVDFYSKSNFEQRTRELLKACTAAQNVLVFRIGQLGDTIVALPAMWAARKHFPGARFTLLCDRHPGKVRVLAADLLRGTGIFDAFESYVVDDSPLGRLLRPLQMAFLAQRLRRKRFDTLIYLAPSTRTREQVERDRNFFALAGIRTVLGMDGFVELPKPVPGQPLANTPAESDLLLARLAASGVSIPAPGKGRLDLGIGTAEEEELKTWLATLPGDGGRRWLGIGPGSKMPAKRWPEECFREVVAGLIEAFDIWPVVLGGPEDKEMAARLLAAWGRGYNAAGALDLRGSAAALKRCAVYLGNDTGTMHLAAAVGVPCVAVFSSREWPGMWFPYGVRQKVFRSAIECEGCALMECVEKRNECLNRIQPEAVLAACKEILTTHPGPVTP
jgi:phosphatidyl-myo-inositol dimannoside synthase